MVIVAASAPSAAAAPSAASAPGTAAGAAAQGGERILRYDVAITIKRDASILVTEQIVDDFGGQAKHGLVRHIPPQQASCWAGPSGATSSCQQASLTDSGATFTQAGLSPHEGLTVAVALPAGAVAAPHPVLAEKQGLRQAFAFTPVSVGMFAGLLMLPAGLGALVVARGRRRERGTQGAGQEMSAARHQEPPMETTPPEELRPGQAGTLLDGVANPRDVTATIADLAIRGYVRIEETGDPASPNWLLIRLGRADGLLAYEQVLLDGLFAASTTTASGEQVTNLSAPDSGLADQLRKCQNALTRT